jgi:HAAS domain-containing protein
MSEQNEVKRYIEQVMSNIHAPAAERERIEADLRAHFQEALAAGESPQAALARMGTPAEVAAEFMAQAPLRYAGFWWRLAAFGLDLAVMIVGASVLGLVAFVLMTRLPRDIVGWEWIPAVALGTAFTASRPSRESSGRTCRAAAGAASSSNTRRR